MAKEPNRVFIKYENIYIEISYRQFVEIKSADSNYCENHHFFIFGDILVEVSEQAKKELKSDADRIRYIRRLDTEFGLLSINAFDNDDDNGTDFIADPDENVEEIVTDKMMVDKLYRSLDRLSEKERELITALFFVGFSERAWSAKTGIPQKTVNDRKRAILRKLKKYLEN